MRKLSAIAGLVTALIAGAPSLAQKAPSGQFLPVRTRDLILSFGYRSDDVVTSGPASCQGVEKEFFVTSHSKTPQSALICKHEFIPGGPTQFAYRRSFVPITLSPGERKSLGCMPSYQQNYQEVAYTEVGNFTPDVDIEQTPYKALVLVRDARSQTMMLSNRHKIKTIEVSFDRGTSFKSDRYATKFLPPMGSAMLGEDGGVTMARYTNPYKTGNTNPCHTFPDQLQMKSKTKNTPKG